MAINKVEYNGNTLVDLTGDTVNEGGLLQGMTAHSKSGALITGIASSTPTSLYAPVGTIIAFMGATAPQDYLACDGTVYNIADYTLLANHIAGHFGSVNFFGGDGTTTFAVPDLRGEFLRGTGTNSHANQGSGANVGVHQDGTEHPYVDSGFKNREIQVNYSTEVGDPNNSKAFKYDAVGATRSGTNYVYDTAISTREDEEQVAYFSSRPTNTSVLYCIAYRDSMEDIVDAVLERLQGG